MVAVASVRRMNPLFAFLLTLAKHPDLTLVRLRSAW
jgi:hypothetical protein